MKNKNIWTTTLTRFALFQITLLVILIAVINAASIYNKNSLIETLGDSVRNSYLIGDFRSVVKTLSSNSHGYENIRILDKFKETISILGDGNPTSNYFSIRKSYSINAQMGINESRVGTIVFQYSRFEFFKNALFIWMVFVFVSSPFLVFEKRRLKKDYLKEIDLKEYEVKKRITEQVSHDIRSPLAVLQVILSDKSKLQKDDLLTMEKAVQRIENIANDFLFKSSKEGEKSITNYRVESVNFFMKNLVNEKRIQYSNYRNVKISFEELVEDYFVNIDSIELYRMFSNVINNSFEALGDFGEIKIDLSIKGKMISITVEDNGKGMPSNVINSLGVRGFTFNKDHAKSGTGLGLHHAFNTLKALNGTIDIKSRENVGTVLEIQIPFVENISHDIYKYVYIEDDEILRMVWSNSADKKGIKILVLESTDKFDDFIKLIDREVTNIYIDHDLGKNTISGEDFAIKLHKKGFKNIFMSSGYSAERFAHLPWLQYGTKRCPF